MFQYQIIQSYIQKLDESLILEKWEIFQKFFLDTSIQEKIKRTKEEAFQTQFLEKLFVDVLGYTIHPHNDYNLETEKKNEVGGRKADGAIVFENVVRCVIELKGMDTTDLGGKVEIQAFSYKVNHKNCVYVITSNFQKLRFYIDNATDYISFDLFNLDYKQFQELYIILSKESLENDLPITIQSKSISKEEEITKHFYTDYSLFKKELFVDLVKENQGEDKLMLFKKSQKLIDRFLFLFFAEDRGLLPPNSIRLILDDWKDLCDRDAYVPLFDRFKIYFGYMNKGFKGKRYNVFPYNGGLFREDEFLDNLTIDDELLYNHTKKLSDYDFKVEVDVDVLGKIFENSLNEIDEITKQIESGDSVNFNSKRKKDGVFYTPNYITKYIVKNTIGRLCDDKKKELKLDEFEYGSEKRRIETTKKTLLKKINDYREWLLHITILDPSCGSGAFLNEALNFLIEEHTKIDELERNLFGASIKFTSVENTILENNIFGVDINEESVEIAKLSLWLRTAQPDRKLNDLSNNIKCGNSLVDNDEVSNFFDWRSEFPSVFENGGFDIIIGNPPYVKEYTNKSSFDNLHNHPIYQGKMDLWYFFGWLGLELIKKNKGYIGYIAPNNWITNFGASKFRNYILDNGKLIDYVDFGDFKVFEDAGIQTMIYIMKSSKELENYTFPYSKLLDKKSTSNDVKLFLNKSKNEKFEFFNSTMNKNEFYDNFIQFNRKDITDLSNWIKNKSDVQLQSKEIAQGIVPPQDFINKNSLSILGEGFNIGEGIFNLSNDEYEKLNVPIKEQELIKPFYTSNELGRYVGNSNNNYWIIYTPSKFKNEVEINKYPTIKEHLDKFKSVITSDNKPYGLHRSREEKFFNGSKILSLRKCIKPTFTYTEFPTYVSQSYNIIKTDRVNLKFLTLLLNSKLIEFWLKYNGKLQGSIFQIDKEPLLNIPIKLPIEQGKFEELFDSIFNKIQNKNTSTENSIKSIYSRLNIVKKIKSLDDFEFNSYENFLKILDENKISKPSINEDVEWRLFIENNLNEIKSLDNSIISIQNEIDNKICELYDVDINELKKHL